MILTVNSSFPEVNQLAAGLAQVGLLSSHVCPYANLGRGWERRLAGIEWAARLYSRSFGRRALPEPLSQDQVRETGILPDFLMAAHGHLWPTSFAYKRIRESLMHARTRAIAKTAARALRGERAVVASWSCAEPVFREAKRRGVLSVLNYPFAHHRYARRYLFEEAQREPAFADSLNGHNYPAWFQQRLDAEIELADRILVGSSFVRDSFISEGISGEKVTVIPYGADTDLFEPTEKDRRRGGKLRLLCVGQLSQRKGISYLLRAASRMKEGVELTLVGRVEGTGRAIDPYRSVFRHIPHVPRRDLKEIYQDADIFVFPTLMEGMPLAVVEAMASGLPVITTANGPGDIVRDGIDGFIVPPRDVSAIVDRVNELRSDPELRAEMARNARSRAQEFTWSNYRKRAVGQLQKWIAQEGDLPHCDERRCPEAPDYNPKCVPTA